MTAREFEQKVTTSINMEKKEEEALDQIRWRERKSKNAIMRRAIQEFIRNHEAGNNTFKLDDWHEDPNFKAVPSYFSDIDTWVQYYRDSNEQDRTSMRIRAVELQKKFRMVDIN